jgi:hypothetical protein
VAVLAHLRDAGCAAAALAPRSALDRARARAPRLEVSPTSPLYTPEIARISASCRPNTFSSAGEISPTVGAGPRRVDREREQVALAGLAPRVRQRRERRARPRRRRARAAAPASRAIWASRTAALSTLSTSTSSAWVGR